jgi:hypothetical protein
MVLKTHGSLDKAMLTYVNGEKRLEIQIRILVGELRSVMELIAL